MQHSKLGASSAARWMKCPGSLRLIALAPEQESSKYAIEGTNAHSIAENCLREKIEPAELVGAMFEGGYGEFKVTQNMADAVKVYYDFVLEQVKAHKKPALLIETKFDLGWLHQGMFGTNDACILLPEERRIIVLDYKHGFGVVEARKNAQLMYYAIGAAIQKVDGKLSCEYDTIDLVIVQPRASHPDGPIREYSLDISELKAFARDLRAAAKETEDPNAKLRIGSHCKYCPALATCPAQHDHAMEIVGNDFTDVSTVELPVPEALSREKLVEILNGQSLFENWLKAINAHALNQLLKGEEVKGFKVVKGKSLRRWKDEPDVINTLGEYGEDLYAPRQLKSPVQIEKLGAKAKKAVKKLAYKPEGANTLVPVSDRREAVNALKEFSQ